MKPLLAAGMAIHILCFLLTMHAAKAQDVFTGLTSNGGPEGRGTAFSIKSDGTNFSIIKSFADWGSTPNGNLFWNTDKNFYGMTQLGGIFNNYGTIFKITSAGVITILRNFDYTNDGAYPYGEFIKGNDGNLYGTTTSGGAYLGGTIFKITTAGVYTVIHDFDYHPEGAGVYGHLVLGKDGNFYGITQTGGTYGYGTIFKMTPSGVYTVLHHINGTTDGGSCWGSLTEGTDGKLYGITYQGGTYDYGTIFKINKSGASFTVLRNFNYSTDGGYSRGDLIQATDGNFYGMTNAGGSNGYGTIFKITSSGTFTVIRHLSGSDGASPRGSLMQNSDGFLYGVTYSGGTYGAGTYFKISTAGAFTSLHSFSSDTEGGYPAEGLVKSSDGNLYGLTSYGGPNFEGTAFKITTGGAFTLLTSFNGAALGNAPYESLLRGSDSAFYGTTSDRGANQYYGTIFKICAGNTTILHTFNGSQGGNPLGSLVQATNGIFYGTTEYGGTNNAGTIFKITKSGTYTVLRNLSNADGANPAGSLIQATDGNLYGMATYEGTNSGGTIFKITLSGNYSVLRHLNTADGYYPYGDLVQATDGNFYGTTSTGGANGAGTIFRITPAGVYTKLRNLSYTPDGGNPKGSLVQHSNGNFYGMTTTGGTYGGGTIFRISSAGVFSVLKHLNPATNGSTPQGKLLIGSDGNFYGMTSEGGTNNAGTIFKITPGGTYTVLKHLNLITDGGNPYGGLIFLPSNTLVAKAQSVTTNEDQNKVITLTGSGGSPLTFSVVTSPKHGTVTGTGANRTYKPAANYSGKDSFTFKISVGCVASASAKVNITVTAVADTPVLAHIGNKSVVKNTTLTFTATATDADKGQVLTFSLIGAPAEASINASTGVFTWTPTTTGNFIFKVRVTDNSPLVLFDEETVTVTVTTAFALNETDNENITTSPEAMIYPNPVTNSLTVTFKRSINPVSATITDIKGLTINKYEFNTNAKNTLQIDVRQLKPGSYFLHIQTRTVTQTLKFIKL